MPARVLFVSKPIAPPFHDGAKCLVRDVARHLERVEPILMSTPGAPALYAARGGRALEMVSAYADAGRFTPALSANLRAAVWLLMRSRAELWHVVFAPNPRSSRALGALKRLRRMRVVQTVASPPRSFERPLDLFFGDVLVAQSDWTRRQIVAAYQAQGLTQPRLTVIPPPVPEVTPPAPDELLRELHAHGLTANVPYFLYPGDIETSSGASSAAALLGPLVRDMPEAVVVFAYRSKTPRAKEEARRLAARLPAERTRFVQDTPHILSWVAGARAVLFPVDDLWGKVDIPIVLLEAMALDVPVLTLAQGPLADLESAIGLVDLSPERWASAALLVSRDESVRSSLLARQRAALSARYQASRVASEYESLYLELLR